MLFDAAPRERRLDAAGFFYLALSLSNHHLTIALAPLPYLLILLLRRRMFLDWLFAGLLTLLLGYLGFAISVERTPPFSKRRSGSSIAWPWHSDVYLAA